MRTLAAATLLALGCAGAPASRTVTPPVDLSRPDPVAFDGRLRAATGIHHDTLRVAGLDRALSVLVPASREAHPPLLVLLHGTNADGDGILEECGAARVAEAHGVVVVAPTARESTTSDWDHHEPGERFWQTAPDGDPEHNPDLLLVRAAIVAAERDLGVDPRRVYVAGHSNGAFFALLVALTLPDRVAAFATNAGGLVHCASSQACSFRAGRAASCERFATMPGWCRCDGPALPAAPSRQGRHPPAYLVHGTDDPTVSVAYTCGLASELRAAGHEVELALRTGEGHYCDSGFTADAWDFFARHRP